MSEATVPEQPFAPKSLLRHRPIEPSNEATIAPGTARERSFVPVAQRASRPATSTPRERESFPTWKRATTTTALHASPRQAQAAFPSALPAHQTRTAARFSSPSPTSRIQRKRPFQAHPLLLLGGGMILMLLLWTLISTAAGWARTGLDDLHYGYPRTYQTDAWVGHNEQTGLPSHFIVLNLHRRIDIIEIQGGDPSHTRIYPGPQLYGSTDDLTPATLSFALPRGKKYPAMILHIGTTQLTYLNTGQTFVPQ